MRTLDPMLPLKRLLMERNAASVEGLDELLAPNLNQGRKRYRKSVENTIDNGCLERYQDQLMQKIRPTKVACSELSQQPDKPKSDSCVPHVSCSDFAEEGLKEIIQNPQ